jgi:hypothetical protein
MTRRIVWIAAVGALAACNEGPRTQPTPAAGFAAVRITFRGATARRADLPASAQACAQGVGATHIHPSWRGFATVPLPAFPPTRYEISFSDVPLDTRVSFRVNDVNWCDRNPTGAVLTDVFANDLPLVQNTLTPGSGDEPGYAFTIDTAGRVTQ